MLLLNADFCMSNLELKDFVETFECRNVRDGKALPSERIGVKKCAKKKGTFPEKFDRFRTSV